MDDRELAGRLQRIEEKLDELLLLEGYEIDEATGVLVRPEDDDGKQAENTSKQVKRRE